MLVAALDAAKVGEMLSAFFAFSRDTVSRLLLHNLYRKDIAYAVLFTNFCFEHS